jgi:hypothetical protein
MWQSRDLKRILIAVTGLASVLGAGSAAASAQSASDLNLQVHGYATQGFLYTNQNNIFTTDSSDGSAAWTDAVVNIGAQLAPKLHFAAQGRFYLLGQYGNTIIMDWAAIDYKASDRFGVRVGKVKTPWGLFNETQDIDPSYIWVLLPQSIYPTTSSNSILAHYGAVVYGTVKLGEKFGKLEYRGWGGEGVYGADDGYFVDQAEAGFDLPNGIQGVLYGAALHWKTPLPGLMVGLSDLKANRWSAAYTGGTLTGTQTLSANSQPNYFVIYQKDKFMVAGEYSRNWTDAVTQFPGVPTSSVRNDDRGWYLMATYKVTPKMTAGFYESQNSDHQAPLGSGRYQKEFVLSGRYDFNEFLYLKAEQHWIQGTGLGFDGNLNSNLQPNTLLTALKLGVTF